MIKAKQKVVDQNFIQIVKAFCFDRKILCINVGLGLLLFAIFFGCFHKSDFRFFPHKSIANVFFFTDEIDNGNSVLDKKVINDSCVGVHYILRNKFAYPYAGFDFQVKKILDLSAYNYVKIELFTQKINNVCVDLVVKDYAVKDTTHHLALRRLSKMFNVISGVSTVIIPFDEFVTPGWWYNSINQNHVEFEAPNFKNFKGVIFTNGLNPKLNPTGYFEVRNVTFSRDNSNIIKLFVSLQLLVVVVCFVVFYFQYIKKRKDGERFNIHYKPIDYKVNETEIIDDAVFVAYINQNYFDSELTLTKIAKETQTDAKIISNVIADKYNCNIKTYINQIRISESQRLLLTSDLNISEIAYSVGFNSPANFNRVFKTITDESPSEFIKRSNELNSSN